MLSPFVSFVVDVGLRGCSECWDCQKAVEQATDLAAEGLEWIAVQEFPMCQHGLQQYDT